MAITGDGSQQTAGGKWWARRSIDLLTSTKCYCLFMLLFLLLRTTSNVLSHAASARLLDCFCCSIVVVVASRILQSTETLTHSPTSGLCPTPRSSSSHSRVTSSTLLRCNKYFYCSHILLPGVDLSCWSFVVPYWAHWTAELVWVCFACVFMTSCSPRQQ